MLGKRALIGDWSVEPALDALQRGGGPCAQPKAMELLVVWRAVGRVVSRRTAVAVWLRRRGGDEALSRR
jgi:hypothetical protein